MEYSYYCVTNTIHVYVPTLKWAINISFYNCYSQILLILSIFDFTIFLLDSFQKVKLWSRMSRSPNRHQILGYKKIDLWLPYLIKRPSEWVGTRGTVSSKIAINPCSTLHAIVRTMKGRKQFSFWSRFTLVCAYDKRSNTRCFLLVDIVCTPSN